MIDFSAFLLSNQGSLLLVRRRTECHTAFISQSRSPDGFQPRSSFLSSGRQKCSPKMRFSREKTLTECNSSSRSRGISDSKSLTVFLRTIEFVTESRKSQKVAVLDDQDYQRLNHFSKKLLHMLISCFFDALLQTVPTYPAGMLTFKVLLESRSLLEHST
jgi:hypothetical protein